MTGNMAQHVILGVGAGISAYKACELLRRLTESGCEVRVIPTRDALRFVGEATWAALSGRPATPDAWADVHEVPHVHLGQWVQPAALRTNLDGMMVAPVPVFWNMTKK